MDLNTKNRLWSRLLDFGFSCTLLWAAFHPAFAATPSLRKRVENSLLEKTADAEILYQDLHEHPELAFHEKRTSQTVSKRLKDAGFSVLSVAKTGIVAVLKNGKGPVVLLRSQMDALPLHEMTGLPFQSKNPAVMHACAHDLHLAILTTSAALLSELRSEWKGTLLVVAEPAEETLEGAKAIVSDPVFKNLPAADFALAFHARAQFPSGKILYDQGPMTSYADNIEITFRSESGYIVSNKANAIDVAARFIDGLRTNEMRTQLPKDQVYVEVGAISGGVNFNSRPSEVRLSVALRAHTESTRQAAIHALEKLSKSLAEQSGLVSDWNVKASISPVINDRLVFDIINPVLVGALGPIEGLKSRSFAADDFSMLASQSSTKTFFFWIGSSSADWPKPWPETHSPHFKIDFEKSFLSGSLALILSTIELFDHQK